jgi:hypothetical protein
MERGKNATFYYNPAGRNKRTVWNINTQPFAMEMCKACKTVYESGEYRRLEKHGDDRVCSECGEWDSWLSHFATFPEKLAEPPILAGSSARACEKCGAPWARVVEKNSPSKTESTGAKLGWSNEVGQKTSNPQTSKSLHRHGGGVYSTAKSVGWRPTCECENEGTGKSIVLDCFAGSGTSCAVAERHGRGWIGIEANADYIKLAEARIANVEREVEEEKRQFDMF